MPVAIPVIPAASVFPEAASPDALLYPGADILLDPENLPPPLPPDLSSEKAPADSDKDSASLSSESKTYNMDEREVLAELKKQLAFLEKLLKNLTDWGPSSSDLFRELEKLSALHDAFIKQAATLINKQELPAFMEKLFQQLTNSAARLTALYFPETVSFLPVYGVPVIKEKLTSVFLYLITGRQGTSDQLRELRDTKTGIPYKKPAVPSARGGTAAFGSAPVAAHSSYAGTPSASGKLQTTGAFVDAKGIPAAASTAAGSVKSKEFFTSFPYYERKTAFHFLEQLKYTEQFIKHLNNGGNLYNIPAFTAKNDELMGLFMAEISLKTQLFSENTKLDAPVHSALRHAIQKLVDYHVLATSSRDAYRVYSHTMHLYQTSRSPKSALEAGLKYALEQFFAKKESDTVVSDPRYSKDSGFFQTKETGSSPQAVLAENIRLLEKDWKQFLKTLQQGYRSDLYSAFSHYSPWAASLEPEPLTSGTAFIRFNVGKIAVFTVIFTALCLLFFR